MFRFNLTQINRMWVTMLVAFTLLPMAALADDTPPGVATNFSAALTTDSKVLLSFTESTASDMAGYLVMRRSGIVTSSPSIVNKINYLTTGLTSLIDGWQVVSNNTTRGGKLTLEPGYTYLVSMRDLSLNYSAPGRIVVSDVNQSLSSNLTVDALVLTAGTITVKNGITLTIKSKGSLNWLGGEISNAGKIDIQGTFRIPAGAYYDNGAGVLQVSAGGQILVDGTLEMIERNNNILSVLANGTLQVAPAGSLIIQKFGDMRIAKDAFFLVNGLFEVLDEVHTSFTISPDAKTTFGPVSRFNLRKRMTVPKATFTNGSTFAYYDNLVPAGLDQSFFNFIWSAANQYQALNLACAMQIRGTLNVENTNYHQLTLGDCGSMEIGQDVIIGAAADVKLPEKLVVKGNLIGEGKLMANKEMVLEGSLDLFGNATRFSSSVGFCKITFDNATQLNRSSVLRWNTSLKPEVSAWEIIIKEARTITLGSNIDLGGTAATSKKGIFTVKAKANFYTGPYEVRNTSGASATTFVLEDEAVFGIGHAQGIEATSAMGAVQTNVRNYSAKAHYIYNGTSAQVTGNGLPLNVYNLTIDAASTVALTSNTGTKINFNMLKGDFQFNDRTLTLLGNFVNKGGSLTGSSKSGLVITNSGGRNIVVPALTLGVLDIRVDDQVKLAGNLEMHQTLNMGKGILYTNQYKITMLPTATLYEDEEAFDEGFVLGVIETEHATPAANVPYTFSNIGLTLTYKGTPAGTTKLIRYTGNTAKTSEDMIVTRAIKIITTVKTGLKATMVFRYMKHELENLLSESNMALLRSVDDGKSYTKRVGSMVNMDLRTVTLHGIDQFSTWSLGAGQEYPGALPVTILNFDVKANAANQAELTWTTGSEKNNDYFVVERSLDGKTFTPIAQVKGQGTTDARHAYRFTDKNSVAGIAYYRLRQVDTDGTQKYLPVRAVTLKGAQQLSLNVYPNPALGSQIQIRVNGLASGEDARLLITDIMGNLHVQKLVVAQSQLSLAAGELKAGTYLVKVVTKTATQTQKLVVR